MKDNEKKKIELSGFLSNEFNEEEDGIFNEVEDDEFDDEGIDPEIEKLISKAFDSLGDPEDDTSIISKMLSAMKIPKDFISKDDMDDAMSKMLDGFTSFDIPGIGKISIGKAYLDAPTDSNDEEEEDLPPLKISTMFPTPSTFAKIKAFPTRGIAKKFQKVAGSTITEWLDAINKGIITFSKTDVTGLLKLEELTEPILEYQNKYLAIFNTVQKSNHDQGIYLAVVSDEEGNFTLFIPEFGNTFETGEELSETRFLTEEESNKYFELYEKNTEEIIENIVSGATFMIAVQENKTPFITPRNFGSFRKVKSPIFKDNTMLQIGVLSSNGSAKTEAFIKGESLEKNGDDEYPLYVHFINENGKEVVYSKEILETISEKLFKVNYEESKILDVSELYSKSGMLYINLIL